MTKEWNSPLKYYSFLCAQSLIVHIPGGGGTRLLNWIGGCRWGGGGCHNALGARKIHPVTIYLITFKCIPCCNIAHLGYTLSDWGCWADKQKKKKKRSSPPPGTRACHKTLWACDPVINEVVRHSQEGRFWYPVSMVMTTLGRFDTLCQYWWPAKSYPVQRHVPITFNNGGAPPPRVHIKQYFWTLIYKMYFILPVWCKQC